MKNRIFALALAMLMLCVLSGCQAAGAKLDAAGDQLENKADSIGQTLAPAAATSAPAAQPTTAVTTAAPVLSAEEAQNIALNHAGLAADQVTRLRAEYEIAHGIAQYDVEFHHDRWEYDYEINADTGEIISFEKDD